MNERMIEKMNELLEAHFAFVGYEEEQNPRQLWTDGFDAATKHCLELALEILREVLRDETSELTYGAASEIQNRLHQELDA